MTVFPSMLWLVLHFPLRTKRATTHNPPAAAVRASSIRVVQSGRRNESRRLTCLLMAWTYGLLVCPWKNKAASPKSLDDDCKRCRTIE
uniref:Secreted protein n=1 Tax=Ixodes ricinus TaxID=34613 RepID=A0A6B0UAU1_IXORI